MSETRYTYANQHKYIVPVEWILSVPLITVSLPATFQRDPSWAKPTPKGAAHGKFTGSIATSIHWFHLFKWMEILGYTGTPTPQPRWSVSFMDVWAQYLNTRKAWCTRNTVFFIHNPVVVSGSFFQDIPGIQWKNQPPPVKPHMCSRWCRHCHLGRVKLGPNFRCTLRMLIITQKHLNSFLLHLQLMLPWVVLYFQVYLFKQGLCNQQKGSIIHFKSR